MDIARAVEYWIANADRKWETAQALLEKKRFVDCLFFCHLTIEMLLKGLAVKNTGEQAPPVHDLIFLSKKAGIELAEDKRGILKEMNEFNMEARYPEERDEFYRMATNEYSNSYFEKTKDLILWLKNLAGNNR